jgi:hypothetical protein
MKHSIVIFLIAATILAAAPRARAFEMAVGGMMWYSKWDAPWGNGRANRMPPGTSILLGAPYIPVAVPGPINRFDCPAMPIGGPLISFHLHPRVGVSAVFMIGKYHAYSTGSFFNVFGLIMNSRYHKVITKFDLDSLINIAVHRYVRLFTGVKYQGYNYTEDIRYPNISRSGIALADGARDVLRNIGPGLGIGLTFPLPENFYIAWNVGGIVMFGSERYRFRWSSVYTISATGVRVLPTRFNESRFYTPGGNTSLSLGYNVPKAGLTLTLGGRYQFLYYVRRKNGAGMNEAYPINGKYDHIYGLTFAAVYSIRFTRETGER